ncbi:MAG: hypothetical protein AB1831_07725 [Pseudomonadota bacterium]
MNPLEHAPLTPAGAPLTSCDLDEACTPLDCEVVVAQFGQALQGHDGKDFVAHYCGLDCLQQLQGGGESEE